LLVSNTEIQKQINETVKILDWLNNNIPNTEESLIKLPWVWIKTAKVILYILYNQPLIAVDTHVHRVCNRLWIVSTKLPEQTSKLLEKKIPKQYKPIAHHCLILFWRYICTAKKPECTKCKLQTLCKRYKNNQILSNKNISWY
jgi:endonuclease-3